MSGRRRVVSRVVRAAAIGWVVVAIAACSAGERAAAPTSSVTVTTAAATTTALPAPTTTTDRQPPTTAPVTTVPAATATEAAADLVDALERFRDDVGALVAAIEQGPVAAGAAEAPAPLDRRATSVASRFPEIVERLPHRADLTVRTAALGAVFAAGRLAAPFLRTAGWRTDEWASTWKPLVDDGRDSLPRALSTLQSAVRSRPRLEPLEATGAELAARVALAEVLVSRAFRSGEFTTPPRAALGFVAALPAGGIDCATAHRDGRLLEGTFVTGTGGCAVLAIGSDSLTSRSRDIATFLADPGAVPAAGPLELVTVRLVDGRWQARTARP